MKKADSLMTFPCDFPIKIIGNNHHSFMNEINELVRKHFPNTEDKSIRSQPSKEGNFLAISILLHVLDQATLDALYVDLSKHPEVKMVL